MPILNLILCALLSTQAIAQTKNGRPQTPPPVNTQSQGGVRDGGGNAKVIETTEQDVELAIENILNDRMPNLNLRSSIATPHFLISILAWNVIPSILNGTNSSDLDTLKVDRNSDGTITIAPRQLWQGARAMENWYDEKYIRDPELKRVINKVIMGREVIDYDFIKKHEVVLRKVYEESGIVFEKFNPEVFRKFRVVENSHTLDWYMLNIRPQEGACVAVEQDKKNPNKKVQVYRAMSTQPKRFSPICVSIGELKKIARDELEGQIKALFMHEFAHQHGFIAETLPDKLQIYWLNEVETGRIGLRNSTGWLYSGIKHALEQKTLTSKACGEDYESTTPSANLLEYKKQCIPNLTFGIRMDYSSDDVTRKHLADHWMSEVRLTPGEYARFLRYLVDVQGILERAKNMDSIDELDQALNAAKIRLQSMMNIVAVRQIVLK